LPQDIVAVSFSGQMQSCVCLGAQGEPLHPALIWSDQRSVLETEELLRVLSADEIYRITGHRASPVYSLEKLMWIRRNLPAIFRRTVKILNPKDYLLYRMTGSLVTEPSDASGTNAFDIHKRIWSIDILRAAGMDANLFPEVRLSTDRAGSVSMAAATETGLLPGTPVICGGGDGSCAAVGAGCITDGEAYLSVGTSAWIAATSSEPLMDSRQRIINFPHLIPGKVMPCGPSSSCGNALSWAVRLLYGENKEGISSLDSSSFARAEAEASEAEPSGGELVFLPYLAGERCPRWNPLARGALLGLNISHQRKDIIRAVFEGISLNLGIILELFQEEMNINKLSQIGGSGNIFWDQMKADVFDLPLQVLSNGRFATAIGAAVCAGVGLGIFPDFQSTAGFLEISRTFQPDPSKTKIYRKAGASLEWFYQNTQKY
jgi:xylulokinase